MVGGQRSGQRRDVMPGNIKRDFVAVARHLVRARLAVPTFLKPLHRRSQPSDP
jgi:hypothetical protein